MKKWIIILKRNVPRLIRQEQLMKAKTQRHCCMYSFVRMFVRRKKAIRSQSVSHPPRLSKVLGTVNGLTYTFEVHTIVVTVVPRQLFEPVCRFLLLLGRRRRRRWSLGEYRTSVEAECRGPRSIPSVSILGWRWDWLFCVRRVGDVVVLALGASFPRWLSACQISVSMSIDRLRGRDTSC